MRALPALVIACLTLSASALSAQNPTGWQALQTLPPQTRLQVKADTHSSRCHITSVTDDKLTCAETSFTRSEIKSIKLVNKSKSTLGGLAIGAGAGAGVGVGIGSAVNAGDKGSFVHVSSGKSAAVGAGVGAILGAGIGALIGHHSNLFATTIYKR